MLVYQISLPKKQDAAAFVTFMRTEYLPAVHKGPTRVGQVTDLVLLQKEDETGTAAHGFLLHVGWSGLPQGGGIRCDDDAVNRKFEAFRVRMKLIGFYREAAAWPAGDAA